MIPGSIIWQSKIRTYSVTHTAKDKQHHASA